MGKILAQTLQPNSQTQSKEVQEIEDDHDPDDIEEPRPSSEQARSRVKDAKEHLKDCPFGDTDIESREDLEVVL